MTFHPFCASYFKLNIKGTCTKLNIFQAENPSATFGLKQVLVMILCLKKHGRIQYSVEK